MNAVRKEHVLEREMGDSVLVDEPLLLISLSEVFFE
jgi:hypothetical protein